MNNDSSKDKPHKKYNSTYYQKHKDRILKKRKERYRQSKGKETELKSPPVHSLITEQTNILQFPIKEQSMNNVPSLASEKKIVQDLNNVQEEKYSIFFFLEKIPALLCLVLCLWITSVLVQLSYEFYSQADQPLPLQSALLGEIGFIIITTMTLLGDKPWYKKLPLTTLSLGLGFYLLTCLSGSALIHGKKQSLIANTLEQQIVQFEQELNLKKDLLNKLQAAGQVTNARLESSQLEKISAKLSDARREYLSLATTDHGLLDKISHTQIVWRALLMLLNIVFAHYAVREIQGLFNLGKQLVMRRLRPT